MRGVYSAAAGRKIQGAAVIAFFLNRFLINERLAKSMLGWTHSGFSLDMSVKIPWPAAGRSPAGGPAGCSRTREALAQYIARPPFSLSKMLVEEHEGSVLYRSEYNPYFKTDCRLFPALEFLVQLLQHLPDPRTHLVRRYGLYSSRSRGTPGPAGLRRQPFRRNGESPRLRGGRVVPLPSPPPPRSRGLEA